MFGIGKLQNGRKKNNEFHNLNVTKSNTYKNHLKYYLNIIYLKVILKMIYVYNINSSKKKCMIISNGPDAS